MFKIGDFSKLGQVSTRMLRHYDKLGLLTPSHTDPWTGYRYYSIDQLSQLHRIVALKKLGLSLEQISHLLEQGSDLPAEQLRGMLVMRRLALTQELEEKQDQLARVEARLQQIEQEGKPSPYEVVVKGLPSHPAASIRQLVPTVTEMDFYCRIMYERLYSALDRQGVQNLPPELTIYHNEEYTETDLDVETAVTIDPAILNKTPASEDLTFRELMPAEQAACLVFEGPYSQVATAILALLVYVGNHNHVVAGPLRELHLSGPAHENGQLVEPAVIELQVPIQPAQI